MKISKGQITGVIYSVAVSAIFGIGNLPLFLGPPFMVLMIIKIASNLSESDMKRLRAFNRYNQKPYHYNKYRRAYRDRR